jgi:CubicO group peptidase (beta-lactamase class C family)
MKSARSKSIAIALFAFVGLASAQDITAKVDELANAYIKKNQFIGSVLVAKGGNVLVKKGYGMANIELAVPNTPETKFRLGSITKQFTATAILQLAAAGKLSVDDKISKYIADTPPSWSDITIHHLLTHTSGIFNYTNAPEFTKQMRQSWKPEDILGLVKNKPLDFTPGSKFSYSNSGYIALGLIVEKASGETYEAYIKKHIFDALDMNASGYDHASSILSHRAVGYTATADGKFSNADFIDMSFPYAAGALYSTVEDLYRWDRALYSDKVLAKASREKMFTPFLNDYAYGWFAKSNGAHKVIAHGGGINGFNTTIDRYPGDDACVVVLSNVNSPAVGKIGQALAAIAFGEKYDLP